MTIKSLLFLLFLYICLVWVGAAYLHSGPALQEFGLRWTAVGLIALLAFIAGAQALNWWRRWRATSAARPKSAATTVPRVIHEDDAALAALISEANSTLARSPGYANKGTKPIYGLPWYLLIGPEGSGKTNTFLNSGLEPELLAGQVTATGPVASTRICNIWLAKNAIFAELSGRTFNGDIGRWSQLLRVLRGTNEIPLWRRFWWKPQQALMLRGVVGFCDIREFTSASADPQRFEKYCRNWQERLRAIGEVFGIEFPVYQIITKCEAIPFFAEYFRQLPESQAGEVLGCTLPFRKLDRLQTGEVFAEAAAKRLTKAFRLLYHALAERRLTHLAYASRTADRPAIYEFPRELKRIRTPLVQFLTDAFRPDVLRPGPLLRGYYLTAVREVEAVPVNVSTGSDDWKFRAEDATRMFGMDSFAKSIVSKDRPKRTKLRWSFVSELFHQVILLDQPIAVAEPVDARLELFRRRALTGVCGLSALFCLAFFISWLGNRNLLHDVELAAQARFQEGSSPVELGDLRKLDALRIQVERLRNGGSWWLHWGLYSGDRVMDVARAAYFRRFYELILNPLNREMVSRLNSVPVPPHADDPYDPIYRLLKTHLTISAGRCPVDPDLVAGVLMNVQNGGKNGADWQALADRQIQFYARELAFGNPSPFPEDVAASAHAKQYLQNITGIDRIYSSIVAKTEKALTKPQRLGDVVSNYAQVLRGDGEVSAAFTLEGWKLVEKASKEPDLGQPGESCVVGTRPEDRASKTPNAEAARAIQRLFVRDYIDRWQKFVAAFSIAPYVSPDDAVRKLDLLSSNRSPLLALFAMTANQTNFTAESSTGLVENVLKKVEGVVKKDQEAPPVSSEPTGTPADITRFFQPVHMVVPPGSGTWVGEKNKAYVESLAHLRGSIQDIATSANAAVRQVAIQNANENRKKAIDAVGQIARGFKPEGLDMVVQRLLEEPILLANRFIDVDEVRLGVDQINGKLKTICSTNLSRVFAKYPFRQSSPEDVGLEELSGAFAPASGVIWKFRTESLGESTVKDSLQWKAKDPAQKPQVTSDMLAFLNRAQQVATAFYPAGTTQAQLAYTLRPRLDSSFKDSRLELEVDGQLHEWTSILQKQFTWPAAAGAKTGAIARIRTGSVAYAFASRQGAWGIFRIMGDAEPRALSTTLVEWKYTRLNGGLDPIQPAPVRMEFAEFPNGIDVFNPQFWAALQCPARAVQ